MNKIIDMQAVHAPSELKQSAAGPVIYLQTMGQPVWSSRDYAAFAKEGYMENAIVFRCIRLVAEACKSIPFQVHKDGQPVEKHPFLDLIAKPNPYTPSSDLMDQLYSSTMISGNTYMEAVSNGKAPTELYVLRSDRMKVSVDNRGYPNLYTYKVGQSETRYPQPDPGKQGTIMHVKTYHPLDDFYGLSPIEPAARAIDTHNAAGSYNAAMLQNMGRPSGALVVDGPDDNQLTPEQFERLKTQIMNQTTGPQSAGRPLLLEGGMKWIPFSQTSQDMEFMEGKNSAARDIAQSLGVPPQLLGIPGDNTYSNLKEANVAFYRMTVLPLVIKMCQALSLFFTPTWGEDFMVWFDMDRVTGLAAEREEQWNTANSATFITTDEKREMVGMEPYSGEGGDDILVSSSLVPLGYEPEEQELDENGDPIPPDEDAAEGTEDDESEGADEDEDGKEKPDRPAPGRGRPTKRQKGNR